MKNIGDPSPFEVANAHHVWRSLSDGGRMLIAFACGVPVSLMARVLQCSVAHVERTMAGGAQDLASDPNFIVWALNVDMFKAPFAAIMPVSLMRRIVAYDELVEDPLTAGPEAASFLVASAVFMAGARSGSLPKRIGYRQMREPVNVRPPRYHGEE
jgi:hypothetical protein